jgi:hypothetical protein
LQAFLDAVRAEIEKQAARTHAAGQAMREQVEDPTEKCDLVEWWSLACPPRVLSCRP